MKTLTLGFLGLGTVGQGAVRLLQQNAEQIATRTQCQFTLKAALVKDTKKARPDDCRALTLTTDANALIDDPEIDILVEVMGGEEPTADLVLRAMQAGKHVVTANKALVASRGRELAKMAAKHQVHFAFEAAVGGGIPIIKALRESYAGNNVSQLAGIINGTANYILSAMTDAGRDYDDVLSEAQALGYAEADPTFDVEGIDAAHKLAILASMAFDVPSMFDEVYTAGISHITQTDIQYAKQLGFRIKHLGIANRHANGIELRVHPALLPLGNPLAHVDGVMNAVAVIGDGMGPSLLYGAGAGSLPTGSAVVGDILDLAIKLPNTPANALPFANEKRPTVLPMDDLISRYYLRFQVTDAPGVLAEIAQVLGEHQISIESLLQKERVENNTKARIVLVTHEAQEGHLNKALECLTKSPQIDSAITRIRFANLNLTD